MEIIIVPIEQLREPEENVRMHPEAQIKEYARSIEMFGQTKPAVIDENNTVLIGNGLVQAMRSLGRMTVDCVRKEGMSDVQKKKMILADNKIFSLGLDVSTIQFKFLNEINDLDVPGFDPNVIATIRSNAQQITNEINSYGQMRQEDITRRRETVNIPEGSTSSPETSQNSGRQVRCPHCGEEFWIP